jgi:MerR family transcriptional regulator, light-induced transcriptional regulator
VSVKDPLLDEYMRCLLAGDDSCCVDMVRQWATDVAGLRRLYVDLIQPSQYRVGELWEQGKISVATEHLATATNQYVTARCYSVLARSVAPGSPKALITCAPGEHHQFGARLLADLLECDGWDVDFYGASLPARGLLAEISSRQPRLVGISAALTSHLGSVKQMIDSIRGEFGSSTPSIAVGGNAFRNDRNLAVLTGADLYASDAAQAVDNFRYLQSR